MHLFSIGINHKTAPIEIRERVAFAPENLPSAHQSLCQQANLSGAVILSTCNRTEVYVSCEQNKLENVIQWLVQYHHLSLDDLAPYTYSAEATQDVLSRLSTVASGLDSLILGEPQILGQLKSAFDVASTSGTVDALLHDVFAHAFSTAKLVRTKTAIGRNPVSVAYAAVDFANRIFSQLKDTTAMLVGAGDTIDLVARHLHDKGVSKIIVANRTLARAETLAKEFHAEAILLADIPQHLYRADIIISSTASQLPIIGKGAVEQALKQRKRRPMYMVDIAVPRDIEPSVNDLEDVFLYTVDDLQQTIAENMAQRKEEATQAQYLVEKHTEKFLELQAASAYKSEIKMIRQKIQQYADLELNQAIKRLQGGEDPEEVVHRLTHRLSNKFLHQPTVKLREAGIAKDLELPQAALTLFDVTLQE